MKLDYGYQSIFNYLQRAFSLKATESSNSLHPDEYYQLHLPQGPKNYFWNAQYFFAPFQHVSVDVWKDTVDTIKSYKDFHQFKRDLTQPLIGIENILKGLLCLILAPIVAILAFAVISFRAIDFSNSNNKSFNWGEKIKESLLVCSSAILDGSMRILRGSTQVISAPITWFIKIPLRSVITGMAAMNKSPVTIETGISVQELTYYGHIGLDFPKSKLGSLNNEESTALVLKALHYKYTKGVSRRRPTNIDSEKEDKLYNDLYNGLGEKKEKIRAYLRLFPLLDSNSFYPCNYQNEINRMNGINN